MSTTIESWARRKLGKKFAGGTGGEGSRGGKVIGHTRSGKPIYSPRDDGRPPKSKGYGREDHQDAAKLHKVVAQKLGKRAAVPMTGGQGVAEALKMGSLKNAHAKAAAYHEGLGR